MKRVLFIFVGMVLLRTVLFADNQQKISQLVQEQSALINSISQLQENYQKITQQYNTEIQKRRDEVLKKEGAIQMLKELDIVDTPKQDTEIK